MNWCHFLYRRIPNYSRANVGQIMLYLWLLLINVNLEKTKCKSLGVHTWKKVNAGGFRTDGAGLICSSLLALYLTSMLGKDIFCPLTCNLMVSFFAYINSSWKVAKCNILAVRMRSTIYYLILKATSRLVAKVNLPPVGPSLHMFDSALVNGGGVGSLAGGLVNGGGVGGIHQKVTWVSVPLMNRKLHHNITFFFHWWNFFLTIQSSVFTSRDL